MNKLNEGHGFVGPVGSTHFKCSSEYNHKAWVQWGEHTGMNSTYVNSENVSQNTTVQFARNILPPVFSPDVNAIPRTATLHRSAWALMQWQTWRLSIAGRNLTIHIPASWITWTVYHLILVDENMATQCEHLPSPAPEKYSMRFKTSVLSSSSKVSSRLCEKYLLVVRHQL